MARRTIKIDMEAYDRLRAVQKKGESFSQVIKRVVRKPLDAEGFLKEVERHPMSNVATAAIEAHIRKRHCASTRRR
jgi:predicted CopG family antitoxin